MERHPRSWAALHNVHLFEIESQWKLLSPEALNQIAPRLADRLAIEREVIHNHHEDGPYSSQTTIADSDAEDTKKNKESQTSTSSTSAGSTSASSTSASSTSTSSTSAGTANKRHLESSEPPLLPVLETREAQTLSATLEELAEQAVSRKSKKSRNRSISS